jgi:hypothetical protein
VYVLPLLTFIIDQYILLYEDPHETGPRAIAEKAKEKMPELDIDTIRYEERNAARNCNHFSPLLQKAS